MRRPPLLAVFFCAGSFGCDSSFDVHYVGTDAAEAADASNGDASEASAADALPDIHVNDDGQLAVVVDGSPIGDGGFCGCDTAAGDGCCVPAGGGSPFCTPSIAACTAGGGMYVGCIASELDSLCCWNGGPGAGGATAFAGACGDRAQACASTSDCPAGQSCAVATCHGLSVGACGAAGPSCPQ